MSPVTTTFEPNPSRVRNICICSGDVFCASSRMMKLSFSVRPRMKASGATSIVPRSIRLFALSGSSMSYSASNSGRRYGSTLAIRSPGQEAEALAGLDGGAREDDARHLALVESCDRERHREVGLAGAGRADAEGDGRARRIAST